MKNDFPGSDIWKLLQVRIVGHLWIEICKNGRAPAVLRMVRVVDLEVFDGYPFRHITGVAKIMLPGIGSPDQAGTGRSVSGGYKNAVADEKFSLPRAAIV